MAPRDTRAGRGPAPSSSQSRQAASGSASTNRYQGLANRSLQSEANAADSRLVSNNRTTLRANSTGSSWERALLPGGASGGSLNSSVVAARDRAARPSSGPIDIYGTDPGGPSDRREPGPYPTVLPALSAAQLGQLAERRRLADQRLKFAEEQAMKRRELLGANATRSRDTAERESKRSIDDFMRAYAGRSLARSPMIAGRSMRRAGEDLRLTYGEIDTKLSTEIAALQDMVNEAELSRAEQIAMISQDEINMRADLERLFPAAGSYS